MDSKAVPPTLGRLADREFFFLSATHAEALARLEYFVGQQWNFAILLGTGGSGRSATLRAFSQRLTWQTFAVAIVDASRVSPTQFLSEVAQGWKIGCPSSTNLAALWGAIEQTLQGFWYSRTFPIVMVDNVDFAPIDVQETIMRLAGLPVALAARVQFILTAHENHLEQIDRRILDRIDLRVELRPWSDEELREFLFAALPQTKNIDRLFTPDAITELQRASLGISRKVRQLVRLVLLAAESQGSQIIDGSAVAAVRAKLSQ